VGDLFSPLGDDLPLADDLSGLIKSLSKPLSCSFSLLDNSLRWISILTIDTCT
jgi:hypothetical protein